MGLASMPSPAIKALPLLCFMQSLNRGMGGEDRRPERYATVLPAATAGEKHEAGRNSKARTEPCAPRSLDGRALLLGSGDGPDGHSVGLVHLGRRHVRGGGAIRRAAGM